jgi:uncharacterized protein YqgC (DUF456 family)
MQPQSKYKTIIKKTFGTFLIALGVLGLIFPILPGWWVIIIGLQILGFTLVVDRKKPWTQIISFKSKQDEEQKDL